MKFHIILGSSVFVTICILSGCIETTGANKEFKNISLESDVVDFSHANFSILKEYEYINETDMYPTAVPKSVEAKFLLKNIVKRDINVAITAYFYDDSNNVVAKQPPTSPRVISLIEGAIERTVTPSNIISYSGKNVSEIHHVKIIAVEVKDS